MANQMTKGISENIKEHLHDYFENLQGTKPIDIYEKFLKEFDLSLIEVVLLQTKGNKVRTAEILGINRNTLSKKMKDLGLESKSFK